MSGPDHELYPRRPEQLLLRKGERKFHSHYWFSGIIDILKLMISDYVASF